MFYVKLIFYIKKYILHQNVNVKSFDMITSKLNKIDGILYFTSDYKSFDRIFMFKIKIYIFDKI